MWKFIIGLFLFAAVFASANDFDDESRFIHMNPFTSSEPPETFDLGKLVYVIFHKKKPACLGSLVGKTLYNNIIATAAHCVFNSRNLELEVQLGPDAYNKSLAKSVSNVIVHPYYFPPSIDYNIALIKTARSDNNQTDSFLEISPTEPSSAVETVTWVLDKTPNKFELANATLEKRASCKGKLADYVTITTKMLCVIGNSSMLGGSPIVFQKRLAGIASFSVQNSQVNLPKVYVNTADSEISSFINKNL